jgi:hypothetical protein
MVRIDKLHNWEFPDIERVGEYDFNILPTTDNLNKIVEKINDVIEELNKDHELEENYNY